MVNEKLICFLDLLGTKESSRVSQDDFYLAISSLHSCLEKNQVYLSQGYSIRGFSDCAFMALPIDTKSLQFLEMVREHLFSDGYFFKCSVLRATHTEEYSGSQSSGLSSVSFGPPSVDAYILHEKYKGIGCILDESVHATKSLQKKMVSSVYFDDKGSLGFKQFWDVAYDQNYTGTSKFIDELRSGNLEEGSVNHAANLNIDFYLKKFFVSRTKNKSYSKYYIPALISIINSSDFSNLVFDEKDGWSGAPVMFYKMFLEARLRQKVAIDSGSEILYYSVLNKIYKDLNHRDNDRGSSDQVKDKLADIFSSKKKIMQFVSKVPNFVFNRNYQSDFLERVANSQLS